MNYPVSDYQSFEKGNARIEMFKNNPFPFKISAENFQTY